MSHPEHFFKYCTPRVAKLVLSTQKVRWNSPLNFDDPFDCYFSWEPKFDIKEVMIKQKSRLFDILCQLEEPPFHPGNPMSAEIKRLRTLTRGQPRARIEKLLSQTWDDSLLKFEEICQYLRKDWKNRAPHYRLFCVCEINDNLLLWSKYTENHSGVAFQFDCSKELDVPLLVADPVVYTDEAPGIFTAEEWIEMSLGLGPSVDGKPVWKRLVTTKSKAWEQEKEWRVVTFKRDYENAGFEDCTFLPQEISKVFFGCRMTPADKADLMNLLTGPFDRVAVYQAEQNPLRFKLDFKRIR
jgi:hypothetical protein